MSSKILADGYSKLRQATAKANVSPSGAAWLTNVLDPYHDAPIELMGIPDESANKTVIRQFESSVTISKASLNLTTAGNWDVQVALLPVLYPLVLTPAVINQAPSAPGPTCVTQIPEAPSQYLDTVTITAKVGPNIVSWPTTTDANNYLSNTASFSRTGLNALNGTADFAQIGPVRLVSAGVEIINNTPEQYIGGNVTVYRVNSNFDQKESTMILSGPDTNIPGNLVGGRQKVRLVSLPLDSESDMLQLPHSQQWNAKDGAYLIGVHDTTMYTDFVQVTDCTPVVCLNNTNLNGTYGLVHTGAYLPSYWDTSNPQQLRNNPGVSALTSIQTCGAYFTGLSDQSTLTINLKVVVESIPDYTMFDVHSARVNAVADSNALELYSRAARLIPAGVPVYMNPMGEWFDSVMSIVGGVASKIGGILGGGASTALVGDPTSGAMIGGGLGAQLGNWFNDIGQRNKRKRESMGGEWRNGGWFDF